MSGDVFRQVSSDEKAYITQHEQREYDSCSWENEEFGKIDVKCEWKYFMIVWKIFHCIEKVYWWFNPQVLQLQ